MVHGDIDSDHDKSPGKLKQPANSALPVLAPQAWISRADVLLQTHATGALAGLTFAVKDNMDVLGFPTTAACPAFAMQPTSHAVVVQKLLDAGACLIGKTNLDQFACGLNGTRSPYGAVPNALNPAYVSGGSSSGSAYVVATGQVDFALGTDTAGSGRVPAGLNNIVGIKPSKGLISTRGIVPAAQSVDCVSIFARTTDLAAKVLQVLAGYDMQDPYSRKLALNTQPWCGSFKFGIPSVLEFYGDALAQNAFAEAVTHLRALGGEPIFIDDKPLTDAAELLYGSALVAERYSAIRSFIDANEHEVIEPVRSILAKGRDYSAADVFEAQTRLQGYGQKAAALWQGMDVLLVPTAPTHYTLAQMQADPVALNRNLGRYTNFVNLLDYAAIAVPSALRPDGLPFGITLIGPCGSDWQLAALGQRYHHARGLPQGALDLPLPLPQVLPALTNLLVVPASSALAEPLFMKVAVVGAHLSGMPLNGQLVERDARLLLKTTTSSAYCLYALPGTNPPKPGLRRMPQSNAQNDEKNDEKKGAAIAIEVWEMPQKHMGSFLALIQQPLGLGQVELADGSWVTGFMCEGHALEAAQDITHYGSWRAYVASQ